MQYHSDQTTQPKRTLTLKINGVVSYYRREFKRQKNNIGKIQY